MSGPVADVWANAWPAGFFAAQPQLAALYARLRMEPRTRLTAADIAGEARGAGVTRVVISATAFPGSPADNRAVAELVAAAPDLFTGCASVDPREGMAAVRELRRAVREDGLRGLKLLPFLYGLPPDDAIYYPLYAACIDLGIPALVLTGHTAVRERNALGRPQHLDAVALHFPELKLVAGHAGYPWTEELIALAWKHERLFIDTSGHMPKHFPPNLLHAMDRQLRGKVMFGTGHPFMAYDRPLAEARALPLKPESLHAFLWGAAAGLWGWA
jgi:predicted TIM-barrel fold metal-dependent hydrolase